MSHALGLERSAHILLVEHDPATAELVGDLLAEAAPDYELTHAATLADACATLARTTPECVMLDVGLGDADGLDGVQELERVAPSVPIIVLTGRDDEAFAIAAVKAGAQDHLTKGRIDGDAMRRAIRHAIERKRSERELARRARHDGLTGLPNRSALFDALRGALGSTTAGGSGVGLLFGDLDGFKAINDGVGHAAGDEVLVAVTRRLRDAVPADALVARVGGDEFAVVVRGSLPEADALARRLAAAVAEPPITAGGVTLAVSIGTAWTDDPAADPDELVRRADAEMYAIKGGPRGVRRRGRPPRRAPALDRAAYLRQRREAEERLRDAEERFRCAFENASIGMAIVESGDGDLPRLTRVNRALTRMLALTPDDLVGAAVGARLAPHDQRALTAALRHTLDGEGGDRLEIDYIMMNGEERRLTVHLSLLRRGERTAPTAIMQVQDVTEQAEAEAALRRSEAAKSAILASALDAVVTIDLHGRIVEFNPAAEAVFGHPRSAALGHDLTELLVPARFRDNYRRALEDIRATGTSAVLNQRIELVLCRADGVEIDTEVAVAATGDAPHAITGFVRDLTPVRRSQQAAAHLAAIVESSDDAILSKDLRGVITSWNAAAERLYGYSAEEAIGNTVALIVPSGEEVARIMATTAAGGAVEPYATTRRRRDGTYVDVSVSVSPVRDILGNVVGAATIARDITNEKAARRALRLSQERYRTLLSQLPDAGVYEYDTDLRLIQAEGALLARERWSPEELRGRTLWDLLPADRAEEFAVECRAALRGLPRRFEWDATEGGLILDVDVVPRRDGDKITGLLVLVRDVTERRRNARSLHIQAQLLDRLEAAVVATDADGIITHWNQRAALMYERPADAALGRSLAELNAEYGLPDPAGAMDALREAGTLQHEADVRLPDGRVLPVLLTSSPVHDEGGALVGFTGIGVDLTPSRRAAEELHGARELFESAFQSAPIGMALLHPERDRADVILRANAALGAMLGRTPEELTGRPLADMAAHEHAEALRGAVEHLLDGRRRDARREVLLDADDGRRVHADVCVALVCDALGAPVHAVALVQDLTHAREAQAEKEALEARLQQAHRLDSIGRLAGGIAHDFNNLLAVIGTYADLVADELAPGELRSFVERIQAAADRAAALTRQLLIFARREIARPEVVDVNDVVTDTLRLLERTLGEDVELRTSLGGGSLAVLADRSQLEQVVLNLAVNARDAMPAGGALTISTSRAVFDGACARGLGLAPGAYIRLEFADTGTGIEPEVAKRMFEPFFTTKPPGVGTGLGLATVYAVATGAGGGVDFESAPGAGTTFTVTLPTAAERPEAPRPLLAEGEPSCGEGQTILLVEDDDALRELASLLLTDAGYRVLAAADGDEALRCARDAAVDLLITDVVMPGISGGQLAERMCAHDPDLPVLFMSGHTDDLVMRHGVRERRVAFLDKPFKRAVLLREVRDALARQDGDTDGGG